MPQIKVHNPGFLTTVQDMGRYGYSHFGISASGAADPVSFHIGNFLVGNDKNAAALEMTLTGGEFEFETDTIISVTGSDFHPQIEGENVPLWTTVEIKGGQKLKFASTTGGARCYLCVRRGIDVPKIFGSSSTHLLTGIGGFKGQQLKKNDILFYADQKSEVDFYELKDEVIRELSEKKFVRVTEAPQTDHFSKETLDIFSSAPYIVTEETNRMGLRLAGKELKRINNDDIITEGVSLGAIQVSHDGQPIILFVEHQTTGGYPKIANVISADIHKVGQLRPRDEVRFLFLSIDEAHRQRLYLESLISKDSFVKI